MARRIRRSPAPAVAESDLGPVRHLLACREQDRLDRLREADTVIDWCDFGVQIDRAEQRLAAIVAGEPVEFTASEIPREIPVERGVRLLLLDGEVLTPSEPAPCVSGLGEH